MEKSDKEHVLDTVKRLIVESLPCLGCYYYDSESVLNKNRTFPYCIKEEYCARYHEWREKYEEGTISL